uniref:Protein ABHD8 n=1 Tax=Takifugu rubripes TaxID=31033 RepID=A0A674MX97_TAKRU
MITGVLGNLLCCTSKLTNVVVPENSTESTDGFKFLEVKPGRVLRVKHTVPDRAVVEQPTLPEGSFSLKRKIRLYESGQLYIDNLGDAVSGAQKRCQNGDTEPNSMVEVDLTDCSNSSSPVSNPEAQTEPGTAGGDRRNVPAALHVKKSKPKRTVVIDCERKISACKGTHPDVVLFFIHGVGGSLDIWRHQLEFFSKQGYETIAVDLVGHGASSAPQIAAAYTFYALAEDIRLIFRRYARKRNVLIGHSYGVSFCTFLAHEYPEQVHKMVLINGGAPTSLEPSVCSIFNLPSSVLYCLSPLLTWFFLKAGFARQGCRERRMLREHRAFHVPSFVLRSMMSGQYWPEGDEVYHAEIVVPTLLVHGMHDRFVHVEDDQQMTETLLMGFLKVVADGSHMVMIECPDLVNILLHEFVLWEPLLLEPRL